MWGGGLEPLGPIGVYAYVRYLLLDWNHWMSVHPMNFYFYLWLLKILWPENTSSHIRRHLEFIIEQGHRVNWVSGSLDSRVTGSLGHEMWPSSVSGSFHLATTRRSFASVHAFKQRIRSRARYSGIDRRISNNLQFTLSDPTRQNCLDPSRPAVWIG